MLSHNWPSFQKHFIVLKPKFLVMCFKFLKMEVIDSAKLGYVKSFNIFYFLYIQPLMWELMHIFYITTLLPYLANHLLQRKANSVLQIIRKFWVKVQLKDKITVDPILYCLREDPQSNKVVTTACVFCASSLRNGII